MRKRAATDEGDAPAEGSVPSRIVVAGIVLAGGSSRRFGSPKLAAALAGRPLLEHALMGLGPLVDEIVVAVAPDAAMPVPLRLGSRRVTVVRDAMRAQGPLVGLLAGLGATTARVALVIGGDMPLLAPEVGRLLLASVCDGHGTPADRAAPEASPAAAALEEAGRARPLPCALRVDLALPVAERLVASGARSLRSLLDALRATTIPEAGWRPLDPDGVSLVDVDTPADLAALRDARSRRPG